MNQPKFKFGDKVFKNHAYKECSVFTIGKIEWSNNLDRYEYGSICGNYAVFTEEGLELYQEPQKKKLYAFYETSDDLQIMFFKELVSEAHGLVRSPEYDIEYPETTK